MSGSSVTVDVVQACRARLFGPLRDEFVQRATRGRLSDAESLEWSRMDQAHRMALLLLAGVDGDLPALSLRAWRELPGPEREAVKAQVRYAKRAFASVSALSGRW